MQVVPAPCDQQGARVAAVCDGVAFQAAAAQRELRRGRRRHEQQRRRGGQLQLDRARDRGAPRQGGGALFPQAADAADQRERAVVRSRPDVLRFQGVCRIKGGAQSAAAAAAEPQARVDTHVGGRRRCRLVRHDARLGAVRRLGCLTVAVPSHIAGASADRATIAGLACQCAGTRWMAMGERGRRGASLCTSGLFVFKKCKFQ
mmetsp:Transcript_70730/g.194050  ORF Transcript_70730/g.194050 Transcript_70730/m.194050 type:complete len:203 (+) Transcript_70730:479-1087(+)